MLVLRFLREMGLLAMAVSLRGHFAASCFDVDTSRRSHKITRVNDFMDNKNLLQSGHLSIVGKKLNAATIMFVASSLQK